MKQDRKQRCENYILTFAVTGASAFLMGLFFTFYFDLNDDTMMQDIMSGIYSGTPDGHNMQTLYPLGALLALCYRACGSFPWYGAFLFLCQFGCFFLAGVRLCTLTDAFCTRRAAASGEDGGDGAGSGGMRRFAGKLLCLLVLVGFQWGIWLTHMVNVQYTVTCGMLVGIAVFLFMTEPDGKAPLLLFLLAFHLRSEMAFLVLPFLGLSGLFHWWEDRPVLTVENIRKYGGLLLLLLAGMGLSLGADSLAYGGEWKAFRQFFNDRTTLYDFYPEALPRDGLDEDLEKLGVSFGSQILLDNYNFGLDERIDGRMLSDVAAYAKEHVGKERDWAAVFKEKLLLYRYRSLHADDAPYNLLVILGYGINIIAIVILMRRDVRKLLAAAMQLFLTFGVRSALWMFVLMRGRDPERITHPLYLVEFCLLAGMFLWCLRRSAAEGKLLLGAAAALLFLSAWGLWKEFPAVQADQAKRQEINRDWEVIDAYCRAHPDMFYFEDVYSTVAFSGKLLERRDNAPANYDIAGGWMCKSPLYQKKLAAFGIEEAGAALTEGKAEFIMSFEEADWRGLTWIELLYQEMGIPVHVRACGEIGENYGVYKVVPVSENGELQRERK